MDPDKLIEDDGRSKCPEDDCDWWVPSGMEYLASRHGHEKECVECGTEEDLEHCIDGEWWCTDCRQALVEEAIESVREGMEERDYEDTDPEDYIPDE